MKTPSMYTAPIGQHQDAGRRRSRDDRPDARQFVDRRAESALQRKHAAAIENSPRQVAQRRLIAAVDTVQSRKNNTGLPDRLKGGVENLSGLAMDDVKVHYNSSQPAQLNALAYARGTDIHLGPGQERHLPHEAWHVVQQKQGRVRPTLQMAGVPVNHERDLENEADVMGAEALRGPAPSGAPLQTKRAAHAVVQGELEEWVQALIVENAAELRAQFDSPPEGKTPWHLIGEYLTSIGQGGLSVEDRQAALRLVYDNTEASAETDDEVSGAVLLIKEANIRVYLDSHQNKHQHGKSMIAELGVWKSKKGSTFAEGRGLAWHRTHTAVTIKNWALAQKINDGEKKTPKKEPLDDGYIYDATAERRGDVITVIYHCNPVKSE